MIFSYHLNVLSKAQFGQNAKYVIEIGTIFRPYFAWLHQGFRFAFKNSVFDLGQSLIFKLNFLKDLNPCDSGSSAFIPILWKISNFLLSFQSSKVVFMASQKT